MERSGKYTSLSDAWRSVAYAFPPRWWAVRKPCLSAGAQVCFVPGAPGAGARAAAGAAAISARRAERRRARDMPRSYPRVRSGNRGAPRDAAPPVPPGIRQPPGVSTTCAEPVSGGAPSGGVSVYEAANTARMFGRPSWPAAVVTIEPVQPVDADSGCPCWS